MSTSSYAYANAKIGAMKSRLLSSDEIRSMMDTSGLEDALSILKDTTYREWLSKLPSYSMVDIENAFARALVRDHERIVRSVMEEKRAFLEQFAKKFEANTIKAMLRMKIAGYSGDNMKDYPWIPYKVTGEPMIEKFLQVESVEELVEMFSPTEYYSVLLDSMTAYKESDSAFPFTAALDKYVYGKIIKALDDLGSRDRDIAKCLLGVEIDAKNFMIAQRCMGLEDDVIWDNMIPYRYKLDDASLDAIIHTEDPSKLVSDMPQTSYQELIADAVKMYEKTESLLAFELMFKRYIIKINNRVFYGDRFHMGTLIGYLNLKENEVRNLITVLKAKEEGLTLQDVEDLIIPVE